MEEHKILSWPPLMALLAVFLLASGIYIAFRPSPEPSITGKLVLDSTGTAMLLPMFSPYGRTQDYAVGKTFTSNSRVPLILPELYGLSISGSALIDSENSLVRVTLVTDNAEYLVYEAYPNIANTGSLGFSNICEETCAIEGLSPFHLNIQVENAEITIDKAHYIGSQLDLNVYVRGQGINNYRRMLKEMQDRHKIKRINSKSLGWIASNTSKSALWYEEKKYLFGLGNMQVNLPNTRGIEYYSEGVFSFDTKESKEGLVEPDRLPSAWDWRVSKGYNLITQPKDQGFCAASWAYSVISAAELLHAINAEMRTGASFSASELILCSSSGSCEGGYSYGALNYIRSRGISPEACFSVPEEDKCSLRCMDERLWLHGYSRIRDHEFIIKKSLIEKGPVIAGLRDFGHSMHLVGYYTEDENRDIVWIFKNSWGTEWGEEGFIRIKANPEDKFFETYVIE